MQYRQLGITLTLGLSLLVVLVGSMYSTPVLQAARPVVAVWTVHQQLGGPQGMLAQLVMTPTKDNTLYESATGSTSNGAGDYLFAGQTAQSSLRRGLLHFDLTGKLPVSATIVSATLQLHLSKTSSGAHAVRLHRLLADWGEGRSNANSNEGGGANATTGDATWLHTFFNTTLWQTPGGTFVPTATATIDVSGDGFYRWSSPTLVADVQSWLANPTTNFGWVIVGNEAVSGTAKRFDTRENVTAANRPQLTIIYQSGGAEAVVYLPLVRK